MRKNLFLKFGTMAALLLNMVGGCGVAENATTEETQSQMPAEDRSSAPTNPAELRNCFHCETVCKPPYGRRCCDYNSSGHAVNCKWYGCGISWNC